MYVYSWFICQTWVHKSKTNSDKLSFYSRRFWLVLWSVYVVDERSSPKIRPNSTPFFKKVSGFGSGFRHYMHYCTDDKEGSICDKLNFYSRRFRLFLGTVLFPKIRLSCPTFFKYPDLGPVPGIIHNTVLMTRIWTFLKKRSLYYKIWVCVRYTV